MGRVWQLLGSLQLRGRAAMWLAVGCWRANLASHLYMCPYACMCTRRGGEAQPPSELRMGIGVRRAASGTDALMRRQQARRDISDKSRLACGWQIRSQQLTRAGCGIVINGDVEDRSETWCTYLHSQGEHALGCNDGQPAASLFGRGTAQQCACASKPQARHTALSNQLQRESCNPSLGQRAWTLLLGRPYW